MSDHKILYSLRLTYFKDLIFYMTGLSGLYDTESNMLHSSNKIAIGPSGGSTLEL